MSQHNVANVIESDPELLAYKKLLAAKGVVVEQLAKIAELRDQRGAELLAVGDSIEIENALGKGYNLAAEQRHRQLVGVIGARKGLRR